MVKKTGVLFWDVRYVRSTFRSTFRAHPPWNLCGNFLHENNGMTTTKSWHRNQKERSLPSQAIHFLFWFSGRRKNLMKSKIPYQKWMPHILKPESPFFQKGPSFRGPPAFWIMEARKGDFWRSNSPNFPRWSCADPVFHHESRRRLLGISEFRWNIFGWIPMGHSYWARAINTCIFFKDIGWFKQVKIEHLMIFFVV